MNKSTRLFSSIAIDQGHEQNNATMKNDGGIVGLTQDPDSLLRWALAGPETIRIISEFEYSIIGKEETSGNTKHHEQTQAHKKRFVHQVKSLVQVIKSQRNPFEEDTRNLIRLHTREIMDETSVECIITIQERGQKQYNSFAEERLYQQVKPIDAPITRNKFVLFNTVSQKKKTKSLMATGSLKSDAKHAKPEMETLMSSSAMKIMLILQHCPHMASCNKGRNLILVSVWRHYASLRGRIDLQLMSLFRMEQE